MHSTLLASYSNSFQFDFAYDLSERFDVRVSYKVNDVKTTFEGIHKKVPLIPNQRGLFNISYATYFDKLVEGIDPTAEVLRRFTVSLLVLLFFLVCGTLSS